jgi:hypothetical protein
MVLEILPLIRGRVHSDIIESLECIASLEHRVLSDEYFSVLRKELEKYRADDGKPGVFDDLFPPGTFLTVAGEFSPIPQGRT